MLWIRKLKGKTHVWVQKEFGNIAILAISAILALFGGTLALCLYLIAETNHSRTEQCLAQNLRYEKTVHSLQNAYALIEVKVTKSVLATDQAELSYDISLVQDLQPKKDCNAL